MVIQPNDTSCSRLILLAKVGHPHPRSSSQRAERRRDEQRDGIRLVHAHVDRVEGKDGPPCERVVRWAMIYEC